MTDLSASMLSSRKQLPLILQSEAAECGLACLAMVAGCYGQHLSLTELRHRFSVSLEGCTLKDLLQYAVKVQLSGRPLKVGLEQLKSLTLPAVLHWDMNHFVVLKEIRRGQYIVHDPATGRQTYTLAQMSDHFTGVALELRPLADFTAKAAERSLRLSDFWSEIIGLKRTILLLLMLSLMLQVFTVIAPYYLQLVVDDVLLSADMPLLNLLALGFSCILLFEVLTQALRSFVLLQFGQSLNIQMAANLFHHLLRLPLNYFEKRHIGDVLSRFGSLSKVKELLTTGVLESLIDGFFAIVVLAVMLFYSPTLSMVVFSAMLLYASIRLLMFKRYRQITEQYIQAASKEHSHKIETLRAMQTLKLLGGEIRREAAWQHLQVDAINKELQLGSFQITYQVVNRFISGFESIIIVFLAAKLVLAGGFSAGMMFAFIAYKTQFVDRVGRLVEKLIEFRMLSLHLERLEDIVKTPKEQFEPLVPCDHQLQGAIAVQDLTFSYSDTAPAVLQQVNFKVEPGESVAIVGPSGCGKTTLMKLMLGLLSPKNGDILLDGLPLKQLGVANYRRQIAAVMQDDQLLSGTIRDNICGFSDQVDMQWLMECARLAEIARDIEAMPMGYNSLIGDMGTTLSGGQKQRLLLARALYQRPRILFLDEATSHLDTATEQAVSRAVRHLAITRIVIAHRQETINTADRVVQLKQLQHI